MTSEEIFYCDIPADENYPATKLKCHAYRCNDNNMFVDGYYEFSIDQQEYQDYHTNCQIKTKDQENIWLENLFYAMANKIEQQYYIAVDIYDDNGYWDCNFFPKFLFSYIYDAYNEI